jgi:hypothetical protein
VTDQLSLFDGLEPSTNGHGRRTKRERGLKATPAGAERLLAEMVKRGLPAGDLRVAASLCLALDEGADR